ncbi:hypothetical protein SAMN02745136_00092 [Anaerocolumna jejuensis DSM 15929]|uniref:Uncharacterized protein n=1 Tax=Anaerocolumna jejuensis DSM 15929 TaxID=1121322 RepID=A0A1M6JID8_9FIRM|nr:hypothetical protein [Anaerocolumna jejuensis]SHJ46430.1 hypothetical protein SAMN02745136_00092 [Anaerocolumna jejuensis DSM 15929]
MKLKGTFIYLGVDTFHSTKNNKDYKSACFLQGTDVQKIFLNEDSGNLLYNIPVQTPVDVELDIRTGQNTFVSLLSVTPTISSSSADKSKTA